MPTRKSLLTALLTLGAALAALQGPVAATETERVDAKTLFTEVHKCNLCHAVPAVEIEAKTKSEKLKGGDLGGKIDAELEEIATYVRKESDLDGKTHKREFKGTDEELQAIVDWLATLEAPSQE